MRWSLVGEPHRYEGTSDSSLDTEFGYLCHVRSTSGSAEVVQVELARGADSALTVEDAKRILQVYLGDEVPPRRLVVTRDGLIMKYG